MRMTKIFYLLFFVAIAVGGCAKQSTPDGPGTTPTAPSVAWDVFSIGGDLSYVNQIQDNGGIFRDSTGAIKDPYAILKQHGANTIRLRLWHNPTWQLPLTGGKLYSNLPDVARSIQRAKAQGLAVNLDFHYSDDWVDPSKQETPAAWKNLSFAVLRDSVYRYTLETLRYLEQKGLTPEMVQIGNENNIGMLHPHGRIANNDFSAFGQLLNAGIQAVRDFSKTASIKPRVILHVAQLQNADWFAKGVTTSGGVQDFDYLGVSHYFKWSTVNTLTEAGTLMRTLKTKYGKPVMVVETAYPWTSQNADSYANIIAGDKGADGYGVSAAEQKRYLQDLVRQVQDAGGAGVHYWEPCWISSRLRDRWGTGSSWENCALFDFSGKPLPGLDFLRLK